MARSSIIFLATACFCMSLTAIAYSQQNEKPYVILISLDGFRHDFPGRCPTPNLDAIARKGVRAKAMQPCFPTKTFPNHYSMVTGLYPDHHGIVANKFYDPASGKTFALATAEKFDPLFYGGEPIWNVAEAQGIKAAAYFWPGSDVAVNGRYPSIWKAYDKHTTLTQRLDSVVQWLQLPPESRPHFIAVYLEQPDLAEHEFGPFSEETKRQVILADSLIGIFRRAINDLPVADKINLIIVSDHGLSETSREKTVNLEDHIPSRWLEYPATMGNPVVFLKAKEAYYDSIASALRTIPHVKGYVSEKMPRRFHFGKNPRSLDFTIIAETGWSIITNPPELIKKGNHGYDNRDKNMWAIFYATGPAFKKGYRQKMFPNISIYPLIAHLLEIKIPPADGKLTPVRKMLK
jgi:alkaline phosphatase D